MEQQWIGDIDPSVSDGDDEFTSGTYRCRDDISNFRINVRVRKVSSTPIAAAMLNLSLSDSLESIRSTGQGTIGSSSSVGPKPSAKIEDDSGFGEVTLGWQEKRFSPAEIKFYSNSREEDFHGDVLKMKFFRDVQALSKRRKMSTSDVTAQRIYTCIDGELFGNDEENLFVQSSLTTNPSEEANYLSLNMSDGLRRRRNLSSLPGSGNNSYNKSTIPTQNIVDLAPTRETQIRLHTLADVSQTMIIRLAIPAENDSNGKDDHVDLCVIKYFPTAGVLEVSPNFTFHRKPYRIELDTHGKERFDYWLEHASPSMESEDQLRESLMLTEVLSRHVQLRRAEVGDDFETPPGRSFRMVVFGEIVSASNFDSFGSKLFVHYFVNLPVGWTASEETTSSDLTGMTQMSYFSAIDGQDVAHFSHPFTLDLFFDINRLDQHGKSPSNFHLPKWPQIFVEVISLDSWTRCRTEGYGFSPLPLNAGSYDNINVCTWRPILDGPVTEMRRYFIGGTPELEDLSYCGTPALVSDKDQIFSRYGFRTASSGNVRLRMNVVHQAKAFLGEKAQSKFDQAKRRKHLMDRLSSATLFSSVSNVLETFKKARERMAKAAELYNTAQ